MFLLIYSSSEKFSLLKRIFGYCIFIFAQLIEHLLIIPLYLDNRSIEFLLDMRESLRCGMVIILIDEFEVQTDHKHLLSIYVLHPTLKLFVL